MFRKDEREAVWWFRAQWMLAMGAMRKNDFMCDAMDLFERYENGKVLVWALNMALAASFGVRICSCSIL